MSVKSISIDLISSPLRPAKKLIFSLAALGLSLVATESNAKSLLLEAEDATPPIGYIQFCSQFPDECKDKVGKSIVKYDESVMEQLSLVNLYVNSTIRPQSDMDQYGVAEMWTYPTESGDCEDYVLLKRRVLIDRGWPSEALMITVVKKEDGEGHSVLTVATDKGDFILDNLTNETKLWSATNYQYIKRQSVYNPHRWVWLDVKSS